MVSMVGRHRALAPVRLAPSEAPRPRRWLRPRPRLWPGARRSAGRIWWLRAPTAAGCQRRRRRKPLCGGRERVPAVGSSRPGRGRHGMRPGTPLESRCGAPQLPPMDGRSGPTAPPRPTQDGRSGPTAPPRPTQDGRCHRHRAAGHGTAATDTRRPVRSDGTAATDTGRPAGVGRKAGGCRVRHRLTDRKRPTRADQRHTKADFSRPQLKQLDCSWGGLTPGLQMKEHENTAKFSTNVHGATEDTPKQILLYSEEDNYFNTQHSTAMSILSCNHYIDKKCTYVI